MRDNMAAAFYASTVSSVSATFEALAIRLGSTAGIMYSNLLHGTIEISIAVTLA